MNPPSGIEVLPNGQWIVEGDTHLSAWAKEHGTVITDAPLLDWLEPHFRDAKVIYDLGANIGDHSLQYAQWGKTVVAIEAHPVAFACLQHNVPSATCLNFAVSDVNGSVNLASCENVGASRIQPDGEWSVPAFALDDYPGIPAPDAIKIDIEGWEPMAITGMAGLITRHKPVLFIEANRGALEANGYSVEGLIDMVKSLGYGDPVLYPPEAEASWPQFDCLFLPTPNP